LGGKILDAFGLEAKGKDMKEWRALLDKIKTLDKKVKIGIAGKYFATGDFTLSDSYISVIEAIKHACWANNVVPELTWLNTEEYEQDESAVEALKQYDGIIVPGGFGSRGIEGKIIAIKYCRENNIPYLGLCYGMQLATIEFARNVCGLEDVYSEEVKPDCKNPVIHIMEEQKEKIAEKDMGGTMRLGAYPCELLPDSKSREAYGQKEISERHRHRYEFNNAYRDIMTEKGMMLAGHSPDRKLVEIIEIPTHKFFVGTQFHPEFKSKPLKPHPLFRDFIKAAIS